MTDNNIDPVQAAEDFLKEASARILEENCPMGDACAVHHRNDEDYSDNEYQYGRMITYVGEYVVVTDDNPEINSPGTALKLVLGLLGPDDLPSKYETCVLYVGDGTLSDLRELSISAAREVVRYSHKHNEWGAFKDVHRSVVMEVQEGTIDLSKSVM